MSKTTIFGIVAAIILIIWLIWETRSIYKDLKEKNKTKRLIKAIFLALLWFIDDDTHLD